MLRLISAVQQIELVIHAYIVFIFFYITFYHRVLNTGHVVYPSYYYLLFFLTAWFRFPLPLFHVIKFFDPITIVEKRKVAAECM